MNIIREIVLDWLFNASVQIGLFAVLAAILAPFIAKIKAKNQHHLYLAVFALCVSAPVFNTLYRTRPIADANSPHLQLIKEREHPELPLWSWNWRSGEGTSVMLAPGTKTALLVIWQLLFLYQLIQFIRGIYRVHRLRRDALSLAPSTIGMDGSIMELPSPVAILESKAIDDPVTVGALHAAIILPSKVISSLDATDFKAILAHEYGHIRRKDFLIHFLCQLTALPVAWHPGIRYLMSKISQTRELACDEYAAVRLGKRSAYARTLLRLATLCLQVPRSNAVGLGVFDGDNLEDRMMMLTEKRASLSRAGLIGLTFATTFLFASSAMLARAVSLQETSAFANTAPAYAGTWHWMFRGKSFATMMLVQNGSGFTGSVTGSKIALDDDGELSRADPSDDNTPSEISKAKLEQNGLRITVGDGSQPIEFLVTLKDSTHADIHPIGAPANMKPIQAERAN